MCVWCERQENYRILNIWSTTIFTSLKRNTFFKWSTTLARKRKRERERERERDVHSRGGATHSWYWFSSSSMYFDESSSITSYVWEFTLTSCIIYINIIEYWRLACCLVKLVYQLKKLQHIRNPPFYWIHDTQNIHVSIYDKVCMKQ